MPTMGGKFYRSYGQGARAMSEAEDSKKAEGRSREPAIESTEDHPNMAGYTHIRHNEDGSHDVKSDLINDGKPTHHADGDALVHHLSMHFAGHDESEGEEGDQGFPEQHDMDYQDGGKEAIETLLG